MALIRKSSRWIVIVAALVYFNPSTALATAFLSNRTLTPQVPNESSNISMTINGDFSSTGHNFLSAPSVTLIGDTLSINVFTSGCQAVCLAVLDGFMINAQVGELAAGTYNDMISIFENGELVDTLEGSFTVVPEPSTALLLALGLNGLVIAKRNKTHRVHLPPRAPLGI